MEKTVTTSALPRVAEVKLSHRNKVKPSERPQVTCSAQPLLFVGFEPIMVQHPRKGGAGSDFVCLHDKHAWCDCMLKERKEVKLFE